MGAEAHYGDIDDLDSLRRGTSQSDGVIHTAFNHDFSTFLANCERDSQVSEAMGSVLAGSSRPLLITSGVVLGVQQPNTLTSEDHFNADHPNPRKASELGRLKASELGARVSVISLSQVHDPINREHADHLMPSTPLSWGRATGNVRTRCQ